MQLFHMSHVIDVVLKKNMALKRRCLILLNACCLACSARISHGRDGDTRRGGEDRSWECTNWEMRREDGHFWLQTTATIKMVMAVRQWMTSGSVNFRNQLQATSTAPSAGQTKLATSSSTNGAAIPMFTTVSVCLLVCDHYHTTMTEYISMKLG